MMKNYSKQFNKRMFKNNNSKEKKTLSKTRSIINEN